MRINEVIRKYRKAANLTQEQVANYLGVTAPAVNKWENGISYPGS
jgi:putative transcriptional regulator